MQFLAGRLLVKTLIAEQYGCSLSDLEIDPKTPSVAYLLGTPFINLSISHTADYLAVSIGKIPVGIDCERGHPTRDWLLIAQNYFSSYEVSWLQSLPIPLLKEEFIKTWTMKEALAKCSGDALGTLLKISSPIGQKNNWPEPYSEYRCWSGQPQEDIFLSLVARPAPSFTPKEVIGTYRNSFEGPATREIRLKAS
ncbi:4'-phosphopantetheinyl transferase family protein [Microbulbifer variabilis]|uniref:4'-phosphopantetheinyl transferase family protein n=1 Tax=Microbulbifer variabilis TaxID=266805 RepID=UPI001CFC66C4|nr:4'-phosphopantetheinyl transferase superfamily protein [Microbulbifer variabilis]